jgi:uncharacterized membrane protein
MRSVVVLLVLSIAAVSARAATQAGAGGGQSLTHKLVGLEPQELRRQLQEARAPDLRRRRAVIAAALIGMAAMCAVTLLQTGIVSHLPDPPGRWFDSDAVNSSDTAYRFGFPDGTMVLASLALTIVIASFGGADRAATQPWVPLALSAKALVDAAFAAVYLHQMLTKEKVACPYCLVVAAATFVIVGLTVPESWRALGVLRAR